MKYHLFPTERHQPSVTFLSRVALGGIWSLKIREAALRDLAARDQKRAVAILSAVICVRTTPLDMKIVAIKLLGELRRGSGLLCLLKDKRGVTFIQADQTAQLARAATEALDTCGEAAWNPY